MAIGKVTGVEPSESLYVQACPVSRHSSMSYIYIYIYIYIYKITEYVSYFLIIFNARKSTFLVNNDPCRMIGQIIIVTDNTVKQGEISYPEYPDVYMNEVHCQWAVQVDHPLLVQLSFMEFDLEQG